MMTPSLDAEYIGRGCSVMSSASEPAEEPGLREGQTPRRTTCWSRGYIFSPILILLLFKVKFKGIHIQSSWRVFLILLLVKVKVKVKGYIFSPLGE